MRLTSVTGVATRITVPSSSLYSATCSLRSTISTSITSASRPNNSILRFCIGSHSPFDGGAEHPDANLNSASRASSVPHFGPSRQRRPCTADRRHIFATARDSPDTHGRWWLRRVPVRARWPGGSPTQLLPPQARSCPQTLELLEGHPARHREEAAVGHQREALGGDGRETETDALRHVLGRLHVEGLHVDHPARHLAVDADLLPHVDLGHLAVGVLEDELVARAVEEVGEHPAVRALAARAREEVAEADVIADLRLHALDAGVEHLDVLADLAGHDGRRRLVDLDPVGAGGDERLELGVHGRHEVPAERQPVVVVGVARARLHVDGEGHRARARRLHRLVGLGLEVLELLDGAEPLGYGDLPDGAVARHAVVGIEAGLPERLQRLQALHLPVEGLDEEEAPHLAVADHVDAGALLVADGELGGVVEGLPHVGLPVLARLDLVERGPEPGGEAVAPHDVGVEQREAGGHAGPFPWSLALRPRGVDGGRDVARLTVGRDRGSITGPSWTRGVRRDASGSSRPTSAGSSRGTRSPRAP